MSFAGPVRLPTSPDILSTSPGIDTADAITRQNRIDALEGARRWRPVDVNDWVYLITNGEVATRWLIWLPEDESLLGQSSTPSLSTPIALAHMPNHFRSIWGCLSTPVCRWLQEGIRIGSDIQERGQRLESRRQAGLQSKIGRPLRQSSFIHSSSDPTMGHGGPNQGVPWLHRQLATSANP